MADIEITRAQALGLKAAREAADRMADSLGRKFDLKGDWNGNELRFERPGVTGSLAVSDKDVKLSVALGFLLKAMKGSIQQSIEHELDQIFAKAPAAKPPPAKAPAAKAPATKPKKASPPRKKSG